MNAVIAGNKFEVQDQPADFWGWVGEGRYDSEWQAIQSFLRPEHTFLDLGAWIGSHSLLASKICRRVVAVEPDPVAFGTLSQNLAKNSGKFDLFQMAISDKIGYLALGSGYLGASTTRANPAAGGGIGEWQEQFNAECMTLEAFADFAKVEDPLFVKMDVEGSEEQILSDLTWFEQHKPTLYMELHPFWWRDEAAVRQQIANLSAIYAKILDRHGNPAQSGARELIFAD